MKKKYIVLSIVFIIFVVLTMLVGFTHEPWGDEAHAWLIARDYSFKEIALDILKYESHPFGWHWILKIFILCGLPYEYFFVIPCLFSYIGVGLLFFKTDLPIYIKILFPFTFFVFYQYTVVARSYCLLLPILVLIAILYKKRLEYPFKYMFLLFLLCFIHLYTICLATGLAILFFIDILKSSKSNKYLLCPIFNFAIIISLLFIIYPPSDCLFFHYFALILFKGSSLAVVPNHLVLLFSDALYSNNFISLIENKNSLGFFYFNIFAFFGLVFLVFKISKNILRFLFLNFCVMLPIVIVFFNYWHTGLFFYTFLFSLWIFVFNKESEKNSNPIYKKILVSIIILIFAVQIYYSYYTALNDYKYSYCGSKKAQKYIKELNTDDILGIGFKTSALCPYFNKKLYKNYASKTFYFWKDGEHLPLEEIQYNNVSVIVSDIYSYEEIESYLDENKYRKKFFKGEMFFKNKIVEDNAIIIFDKI